MNLYECRITAETGELTAVILRPDWKTVDEALIHSVGFSFKAIHNQPIGWADYLQGDYQEIIIAADTLMDASRKAIYAWLVHGKEHRV